MKFFKNRTNNRFVKFMIWSKKKKINIWWFRLSIAIAYIWNVHNNSGKMQTKIYIVCNLYGKWISSVIKYSNKYKL